MRPNSLLIVGGGYWGTAAALLAHQRGLRVTILDDKARWSGSRAASGHFAFGWYKGDQAQLAIESFALAERHGVKIKKTGAHVHGYGGRSFRDDWYTFDPAQFLGLVETTEVSVTRVFLGTAFGVAAETTHGPSTFSADSMIIAAGARTDVLLKASHFKPMGVTGLHGRGLLFLQPDGFGGVHLQRVSPYRQIAVREWGPGLVRVGETMEVHPDLGSAYVTRMLEQVQPLLDHLDIFGPSRGDIVGVRPICKRGFTVQLCEERLVAMSGGGRVGGIPAFAIARRALKLLGVD
jgi:glycine/D-amino acid oxidase-like deaminating enzyme